MYKQTEQNVYRVPTEWSLKLAIYVFRTRNVQTIQNLYN